MGILRRLFTSELIPLKFMSGILQTQNQVPVSARSRDFSAGGDERRLQIALEISQLGTWSYDPPAAMVRCDKRMLELWGLPDAVADPVEMDGIFARIHPEDRAMVEESLQKALNPDGDGSYATTYRICPPGGCLRWITTIGRTRFEGTGHHLRAVELVGTARDSTDENQTARLLLAQKDLLERIAKGDDLRAVLDATVKVVAEQSGGGAVASIMRLDRSGTFLQNSASAGLPTHYLDAIGCIGIDPLIGTCTAAAALNEAVFSPDLETDPHWEGKRDLPLSLGLRAVWSLPIRASDGSLLGTLGTYFREARLPDQREQQVAGVLAEIASLAFEKLADRERLDEATGELLRRQRLYEAAVSNTPDLIYVFDLDCRFTYANNALLAMWGKSWEESIGKRCEELGYEPWHAEMHEHEIDEVVRTKAPVIGEVPFNGTGGRRIYEYIFTPVFSESGEVEAVSGTTRDVTERKNAERKALFLARLTRRLALLGGEEELLREATLAAGQFLDVHRCYFVEYSEQNDKLDIKWNWLRDADSDNLSGSKNLTDFGGPEWREKFLAGNFAVSDVKMDSLTKAHAANYDAIEVRSYAVQPFNRDGQVTAMLAVSEDRPREWTSQELILIENILSRTWPLVERIRSEVALRKSEEHLRLITNQIPALISYFDKNCRYRFINEHYIRWFNLSSEDILGRHAREILGEETFQERLPGIERALAGESLRMEGRIPHHSLGIREVDLALVPDMAGNGEVGGFYVMGFDITEHKRSELTLSLRSERLRLLWESARILLTTDDPDTMLHRLFEQVRGHLGADAYFNFTIAEGGKSLLLRSWHGISEEEAAEISLIGVGSGPCGLVALNRKPVVVPGGDGCGEIALSFGARAYAGYPLISDGQVLGTLAFASRSRDSFSADELEFIETISHYVTAAYVRLELVANLQEGDRRKDEFLATLAHELRNPLAPIRTGIEVLKHSLHQPEKIDGVIGIIERQTAQMVRLIDDLIDVSRITRGTIELRNSIIDLAEVIPSAIEAVQPLIDRSGHTLLTDFPDRPVHVDGDAGRLSQVFANLLNNAARYSPDGGRIVLSMETTPDSVIVRVKDEGEGIDPLMQDQVFEMFTQIKRPGTTTSEGLGIGLTLVRLLVNQHGGSIEVFSEGAGKGSEFKVSLPLVAAEAPAEPEPEAADQPAAGHPPCRILVVDDGVSAADMLALFFKLEGYETCTAYDGIEALEVAEKNHPRVVFMDIGMPRMDGYEAARRLRQIPGCEHVILIALTGWGQESDREKTRLAGFDHHLVKPVEPGMLRSLLAELDMDGLDQAPPEKLNV